MGWSIWRCPDPQCNSEKRVKFSRSCPHCGVKACLQWINNTLAWLPEVPWQHITFTMPCEYWPIIRANRWLLGEMNRLAADVILTICHDLNITRAFSLPSIPGDETKNGIRIFIFQPQLAGYQLLSRKHYDNVAISDKGIIEKTLLHAHHSR